MVLFCFSSFCDIFFFIPNKGRGEGRNSRTPPLGPPPDSSNSPIFRTNFRFPWRFENSGFHCTYIAGGSHYKVLIVYRRRDRWCHGYWTFTKLLTLLTFLCLRISTNSLLTVLSSAAVSFICKAKLLTS